MLLRKPKYWLIVWDSLPVLFNVRSRDRIHAAVEGICTILMDVRSLKVGSDVPEVVIWIVGLDLHFNQLKGARLALLNLEEPVLPSCETTV